MNDNAAATPRTRLEHHLDQLIWRLARIEGDLQDLRKALNAFRADLTLHQHAAPPDDCA